jgi:hypothetical protein
LILLNVYGPVIMEIVVLSMVVISKHVVKVVKV